MTSPTELTQLRRIQAGDEQALIDMHAQYARLVYSVAYRVLGDSMAAEEVTQDTFMRVWRSAGTFDARKGSFVTWLLTIARRLAIDTFRKQQRAPVLVETDPEGWDALMGADESQDLRRTLASAVRDLPDEQRQAIELAYFYGLTHSQIADFLGEPLGTIKTRIRLGMQKLREAWLVEPAMHPNRDDST